LYRVLMFRHMPFTSVINGHLTRQRPAGNSVSSLCFQSPRPRFERVVHHPGPKGHRHRLRRIEAQFAESS
jgi:hypothetical protein